jgi:UDP-N-acetylmuramyl tripeptide synthase
MARRGLNKKCPDVTYAEKPSKRMRVLPVTIVTNLPVTVAGTAISATYALGTKFSFLGTQMNKLEKRGINAKKLEKLCERVNVCKGGEKRKWEKEDRT